MKFISLFTKAPQHKRFSYEPRFYDPKEEERRDREERIRREVARERGEEPAEETSSYRNRIQGSFHSARRRSNKSKEVLNENLIRLGILLFLTLELIAFFTWGKAALYGLALIVPVYLWIRLKR